MQRDPEKEEAGLIHRLLLPGAGNVLEVGCGNGRLTDDLRRIADKMVAVDSNVDQLSAAKDRVEIPVNFIAASGESLPFAANSMDTVVYTLSLHHQAPDKALNEARRVLREDGHILVLEPAADSLVGKLFAVLDDESGKYESAEKAIDSSDLELICAGSVKTCWVFENFTEMVCYLFDYFGLQPESQKEKAMAQIINYRQCLEPLSIEDITRFWLLGN